MPRDPWPRACVKSATIAPQVRGQTRHRYAPSPLSTLEMQKRGTQYLRLPGEPRGFEHFFLAPEAVHCAIPSCRLAAVSV